MNRWRCRRYRISLVDCAAGRPAGPERQRLERHLAHCPACARNLAALRELPAIFQRSTVADPGEEFWLRQRREISRAVRNLPEPRWAVPLAAWLERLYQRPWRAAFTAAAAALVALTVYRVAEPPPASQHTPRDLAALDSGSLAMLHDFMEALAPDEGESQSHPADEDMLLAALSIHDLVGANALPEVPQAGDLNEEELEVIGNLIGGMG